MPAFPEPTEAELAQWQLDVERTRRRCQLNRASLGQPSGYQRGSASLTSQFGLTTERALRRLDEQYRAYMTPDADELRDLRCPSDGDSALAWLASHAAINIGPES